MQLIELTSTVYISATALQYLVSIEDGGGGAISLKFMRDGSTQTVSLTSAVLSDIADKVARAGF